MSEFKGTKNWRIRYADKNDEESFFFIEADLEKEGFYPRVEVMQEDFGEHNGYTKQIRLADGKLIVCAHEMLNALIHIEDYTKRSLTLSGHSEKDIDFILRRVSTVIKKATEL